MLSSILSFVGGIAGLFGKVVDYINKRHTENIIKNNYEKEKEIAVLKETQKVDELTQKSKEKFDEVKKGIDMVSDVNMKDATLTKSEIKEELDGIVDEGKKADREKQIEIAKDIKEAAVKEKKKIEKNEKFNSGEEITFKG